MFSGLLIYDTAPEVSAWVKPKVWTDTLYPRYKPDISGHQQDEHSLLVEADIYNMPYAQNIKALPLVCSQFRVSFWGRLDNREDLARDLGIETALPQTADAVLILAGWKKWGEELPKNLIGDFAFAVIDREQNSVFLARDPIGIKPLYYWAHEDGLVFASTAAALTQLNNAKPTPDKEWMALYIIGQSMSHVNTAYHEIKKLPGGHSLSASGGTVRVIQYHHWRDDTPEIYRRDNKNVTAYRAVLETAMRDQMISDYTLGTESSGGIDSSTITAYLGKFIGPQEDKIHSFAYAMLEQEAGFINEVNEAASIKHNHVITKRAPDNENDAQKIYEDIQVLGYPEEHGNATGHRPFYELCNAHNIRTLFSGYGGDEVVTNYAHTTYYEFIDKKKFFALYNAQKGNVISKFLRTAKWLWKDRRRPSYHIGIMNTLMKTWAAHPLRDDIATKYGLKDHLLKAGQYDATYRRHNDWILNGMLKFGYVPTRLENCTLIAASYGIDYRWPLWDQRLVQQYLSTPIVERRGPDGFSRYLHRMAITGTVPDRIAWKRSKHMGDIVASRDNQIGGIIEIMKQIDTNLHPTLEELIDRNKWRANIKMLEDNPDDSNMIRLIRRYAISVLWLNIWLHGKPVS